MKASSNSMWTSRSSASGDESGSPLPRWCDFVVYQSVIGSQAYGLATEASDVDRRGFYLPPARLHWSLQGVPEQIETAHEAVYWEIEKLIRLALKANPTVLECLYSPLVEVCEPPAAKLIAQRSLFLSRLVYQSYSAYVSSQLQKIDRDLRNQGEIRWKHVMHLIRLLLSGITILRDGYVPLTVASHRDQLLSIRRGELDWKEIENWRLSLQEEFDRTFQTTCLPDAPDHAGANELLLDARRWAAAEAYGNL